jgi:hypothetical protein
MVATAVAKDWVPEEVLVVVKAVTEQSPPVTVDVEVVQTCVIEIEFELREIVLAEHLT